jgi:hypothetical protein
MPASQASGAWPGLFLNYALPQMRLPRPLRFSKGGDFRPLAADSGEHHLVHTFVVPSLRTPRRLGQPQPGDSSSEYGRLGQPPSSSHSPPEAKSPRLGHKAEPFTHPDWLFEIKWTDSACWCTSKIAAGGCPSVSSLPIPIQGIPFARALRSCRVEISTLVPSPCSSAQNKGPVCVSLTLGVADI